ncbi:MULTISPECIES: hypothetical protein [Gammaproteobacteria]|uniref:hypothetical protein n=1 Tax=Gammaproteobacteria TaxID=1236 RepID=UPI001ADD4EC8|nr:MULTISPECIES: hypothetical protein [Gammaproteobacteria]MBO9481888.1 hypothetical protein [Salinisphaera sp. G21_0]MBO9492868.1 hypothetical protein [Thalassotalea sp. G20_0]
MNHLPGITRQSKSLWDLTTSTGSDRSNNTYSLTGSIKRLGLLWADFPGKQLINNVNALDFAE